MTTLRKLWHAWKRFGQAVGDFIARIVLTIFYWTIFLPFGLGVRLFSDPLSLNDQQQAGWLERTTVDTKLEDTRRLY